MPFDYGMDRLAAINQLEANDRELAGYGFDVPKIDYGALRCGLTGGFQQQQHHGLNALAQIEANIRGADANLQAMGSKRAPQNNGLGDGFEMRMRRLRLGQNAPVVAKPVVVKPKLESKNAGLGDFKQVVNDLGKMATKNPAPKRHYAPKPRVSKRQQKAPSQKYGVAVPAVQPNPQVDLYAQYQRKLAQMRAKTPGTGVRSHKPVVQNRPISAKPAPVVAKPKGPSSKAYQLAKQYSRARGRGGKILGVKDFDSIAQWMDKYGKGIVDIITKDDGLDGVMHRVKGSKFNLALDLVFFKSGATYIDLGKNGHLGEGGFKSANKAIDFNTGEVVAHLHEKNPTKNGEKPKDLDIEVKVGKDLGKKGGIAPVYDWGFSKDADGGRFSIISKMYAGDMNEQKGKLLTRAAKLRFAKGLLTGMKTMHDAGICHSDIKPANTLVSSSGNGVLADFGGAFTRARDQRVGTMVFQHPEMFVHRIQGKDGVQTMEQGKKYDLHALGLTLGELFGDPQTVAYELRAQEMYQTLKAALNGANVAESRASMMRKMQRYKASYQQDETLASTGMRYVAPEVALSRLMRNPDSSKIPSVDYLLKKLRSIR